MVVTEWLHRFDCAAEDLAHNPTKQQAISESSSTNQFKQSIIKYIIPEVMGDSTASSKDKTVPVLSTSGHNFAVWSNSFLLFLKSRNLLSYMDPDCEAYRQTGAKNPLMLLRTALGA